MNDVVKFLSENRMLSLATIGLDGKAKCRPFMFALERDAKIWFCTSNQKEVYNEMIKQPYVEFTTACADFSWIRLSAEAVFENNLEVKAACLEFEIVKNIYKTADNPLFEVFYLKDVKAIIADFSGNPPRTYEF